jgi:hypothetical protein
MFSVFFFLIKQVHKKEHITLNMYASISKKTKLRIEIMLQFVEQN